MKRKNINGYSQRKAQNIIERKGGMIRTTEAIKSGIHPRIFYSLRDSGVLEQISRGVYRLSDQTSVSNPGPGRAR